MAVHYFTPSAYHRTLGSHPPVLEIASGDTVVTTTVDASGHDQTGKKVTMRGNPQTGPFFIAGAEPGDTLAVEFDQITPNRPYGYSGCVVAPRAVEPEYVTRLPERMSSRWEVDVPKGMATLIEPTTKLGRFSLPLRPMLGCFGVAPPRDQFISSGTSGPYGGNMDYNGFTSETIVYLPVFVEGALFHLGDGHALQGDGELLGTGVEISMNVRFTVNLLKGRSCQWPRGEKRDEIFTVGNARPFDEALQHAVTEMLRWLEEDYDLDQIGAHLLIGQSARLSVGNFFDAAYTAVCHLPKELLSSIRAV